MPLPIVGAQLLVFNNKFDVNTDTALILDAVVDAGYAAVEGGSNNPSQYKSMLDERGLLFGGMHVLMKSLLDLPPLIAYARAVDTKDLCVSGLMEWESRSYDDYLQAIDILNEHGKTLRSEGIQLHYHHHEFEFEKVHGEQSGMDLLVANLDPACADLCVDIAWVQKGGHNPAEFIKKHEPLISYLHFKDYNQDGWCELGRGIVDIPSVIGILPELNRVPWVMVEQDSTNIDPRESIAISRAYLRNTFGY